MKSDILKRTMWFVPMNEIGGEWLGLKVNKVKEYMELNARGERPVHEKPKVELKVVELEFKNDMGTEDINRLDQRAKNKPARKGPPRANNNGNGNSSNNNRNRNRNNNNNNGPKNQPKG